MILTKPQKCIAMRNGVQIWLDEEKADRIAVDLTSGNIKGFFMADGNVLNTADIIGIFKPQDMEDQQRRKNGQWQCEKNVWHERNEKCGCFAHEKSQEEIRRLYPEFKG